MMSHKRSPRLLNRDGSVNISRTGRVLKATDLYHSLLSLNWAEFALLMSAVYVVVNLFFAIAYFVTGPGGIEGANPEMGLARFLDCFFFSVQTFATIGFGKLTPGTVVSNFLVTIEALVGFAAAAISTGLIFARFARPTARVLFSNVAVIQTHDGVPSLVFRLANQRMNQLVDAQIDLILLKTEITEEGERYRTFTDLKLERHRSPIVALSWTVVHPITPDSPLHGKSEEELIQMSAELLVTMSGIDSVFSQTVHTRFSYTPEEIRWNHRFKDMFFAGDDGKISVNLDLMHETEPA